MWRAISFSFFFSFPFFFYALFPRSQSKFKGGGYIKPKLCELCLKQVLLVGWSGSQGPACWWCTLLGAVWPPSPVRVPGGDGGNTWVRWVWGGEGLQIASPDLSPALSKGKERFQCVLFYPHHWPPAPPLLQHFSRNTWSAFTFLPPGSLPPIHCIHTNLVSPAQTTSLTFSHISGRQWPCLFLHP